MIPSRIFITGIPFDNVTSHEAIRRVEAMIGEKKAFYVVTPNPEILIKAQKDDLFRTILKNAPLSIPDGTGILWAANYLQQKKSGKMALLVSVIKILISPSSIHSVLKERVTGTDFMIEIVRKSVEKGWKIFLLGGREGVAKKAAKRLEKIAPGASVVGYHSGESGTTGDEYTCKKINKSGADILCVAYGSPQQEKWIARNLPKMTQIKVAMGVGGGLDFLAGKTRRSPIFLQKIGLEWLWRLATEPWRIKRIWNATIGFIRLIDKEKNLQNRVKMG